MLARAALALLVLAAVTLTACGGGGSSPAKTNDAPPPPEAAVRTAAVEYMKATDPKVACGTRATTRLVEDVYKSLATCEKAVTESAKKDKDKDLGVPSAGDVRIEGTQAITAVSVKGGEAGGSAGHLTLVREGPAWKVDHIEIDYLRSMMATAIKKTPSGPVSVPAMRTCMLGQIDKLTDQKLRSYMYKVQRNDSDAKGATVALAKKCPHGLTAYYTQVLTGIMKKRGASAALLRCARRDMPDYLEFTGLNKIALEFSTKGDEASKGALAAALAGVIRGTEKACKKTT